MLQDTHNNSYSGQKVGLKLMIKNCIDRIVISRNIPQNIRNETVELLTGIVDCKCRGCKYCTQFFQITFGRKKPFKYLHEYAKEVYDNGSKRPDYSFFIRSKNEYICRRVQKVDELYETLEANSF